MIMEMLIEFQQLFVAILVDNTYDDPPGAEYLRLFTHIIHECQECLLKKA